MTFVATKNNKIVKFKRTSTVCELGSHDSSISGLHCVGDILVSTDIGGGIQVIDIVACPGAVSNIIVVCFYLFVGV